MRKSKVDLDILLQRLVEVEHMSTLLKKLFDRTFWKFILVGVTNTLFGTGIMFVFYNVFHFSYWISSASNYFFGSILSYILNRLFTFQNKTTTANIYITCPCETSPPGYRNSRVMFRNLCPQ